MIDESSPLSNDVRIAYAESLTDFVDQRHWYSQRAGQFKSKAQRIDLMVIVAGALIAALPILKPSQTHWVDVLITALGVGIVVAQGMQRVYRYGEIWPEYRLASERMKRETRVFINGVGEYATNDTEAQATYVLRLEGIIAQEQKIYFESNGSEKKPIQRSDNE